MIHPRREGLQKSPYAPEGARVLDHVGARAVTAVVAEAREESRDPCSQSGQR